VSDDQKPKTAYELAMERLRAQDEAAGVAGPKTLSPEQKERIARLRREAKAKLAEIEIFRNKAITEAGGDPAKLEETEEKYRIDRERIESRLETAVRKVKEE